MQCAYELKLYTDNNGVLWYNNGREHSASSVNGSIDDFLTQTWLSKDVTKIKVLGHRSTANLICKLYEAQQPQSKTLLAAVHVGSPAVLGSKLRANPLMTFSAMDELVLPASCGGWHELCEQDYRQYDLVRQLDADKELTATLHLKLRAHPAYPAVSFIPTVNYLASAQFLAEIVDPRWFVDPLKPDRTSRLRSYFGMHLDTMRKVLQGNTASTRAIKAHMLYTSWACGSHKRVTINSPADFLFKLAASATSNDKGMLKACVKYLTFVRGVWLQNLATRGRTLFVPEYFFNEATEVTCFKEHLKRLVSS